MRKPQRTATCTYPGCGKVYTGTFAPQSLATHKRKAHPPQPPSVVVGPGPGDRLAHSFPTPQHLAGLVGLATIAPPPTVAPKPDTIAHLTAARDGIDARLEFLRQGVRELEAMQAEILRLQTERQAVDNLMESLGQGAAA